MILVNLSQTWRYDTMKENSNIGIPHVEVASLVRVLKQRISDVDFTL